MLFGYSGQILHVDLTHRKVETTRMDEAFYRSYLGGRGIGYHYLMKMVPTGIDPLASENVLVLATCVMTGSPLAASCRFAAAGNAQRKARVVLGMDDFVGGYHKVAQDGFLPRLHFNK